MLLFRIHHVMNQMHTSKILYAAILNIVIHDPHNCCSWWCLLLEQGTQNPRPKNHGNERIQEHVY